MSGNPKKPLAERILAADLLGSRWLADGNEAADRGERERAEYCYKKGQFWLDRSNLLRGNSDKPPPKR
jgi:hypothetical protein